MTLDLAIDYQILTAPKAGTRQKIKELNFIKIKKKCASNDAIWKVKRQPLKWQEILANHANIVDLENGTRILRKSFWHLHAHSKDEVMITNCYMPLKSAGRGGGAGGKKG